jgi:PHD/YefM family antitoxin component YafN of YafNO toxin-antitoxin module
VKRPLRPRATEVLSVAPVAITDRNAPATVGLEAREFRQLVRDLGIAHLRRGQRIIVVADLFRAAISDAARSSGNEESESDGATNAPESGDEPVTADRLLARLGRVRVREAGGER